MMEVKKNYDSEFCGNVPLNFVNNVQAYGVLMVLDRKTLEVLQVSENIHVLFGLEVEQVLGKDFSTLLDPIEGKAAIDKLLRTDINKRISLYLTLKEVRTVCTVHFKGSMLVLELEKSDGAVSDFSVIFQEVKTIVAALETPNTTEEVCQVAAAEIKKLSGFDKVMIYQFDKDWNGHVIAEKKEADMDSYLGLVFPASDIPKQARALYFKNPYRLIPDAGYEPVKLNPALNPQSFTYTDLADCNLRSVAPVHVEYLKNMKVMSSMSTAIIKDNILWGLIACHHKTPKMLPYDMRAAFELLSNYISTQLTAKERESDLVLSSKLNEILASLYKRTITIPDFTQAIIQGSPNVLDLLGATGVAVIYKDRLSTYGEVPDPAHIKEIAFWLNLHNHDKVYALDAYKTEIELPTPQDTLAGMIAIPISPLKGEYLLGFRPEIVQTVSWGGNPNEAIQFEADKKNYHPRHSFEIWKDTVRNTSAPWEPLTIKAAENLRSMILEVISRNP
ncbi:MAG TPA: GAF domain-containing protein [Cytophagales bacterium]|nr:GAF domain-containing protein [Cytophagales bacterium]